MRKLLWILLLCGAALTASSCSDEGDGTEDTTDGDADIVEDIDETDGETSPDVPDLSDGDTDEDLDEDIDDGGEVRTDVPFGEPCISGLQCISDLCVVFASGVEGFCSRICEQNADCRTEGPQYDCLNLPQSSSDEVRGCIDTGFCYDPDEDGYGEGPGCENIGFDCDQTDPNINPGEFEQCDAIDHNCNGLLIDSVVFEEPDCTVDDPSVQGVCATGERRCEPVTNDDDEVIDGTEVCEQIVFAGELDEVCNGRDDDCDGVRDDFVDDNGTPDDRSDDIYEVPGLGLSCSTDVSSCPNGITQCDQSSGEVVCVATGENPSDGDETLVCDGIDNDCDGETDEPFKDENGIYFQTENCGSCDVDCNNFFEGRPEDFNVVPFCDVQEDFAVCDFDCAEGFVDADGLDDNGCELNPDEEAIYVTRAARGGEDTAECGSYESPCATIAFAINKADNDESKSRVRVAEGSYDEAVELRNGVGVLGGHNASNWTRNIEANVTTLTGVNEDANQAVTVTAENITESTEFSGFTIRPASASNGRNSVGIYIVDSGAGLVIRDNRVEASSGGSGTEGSRGSNGQDGASGDDGQNTLNNIQSCLGGDRDGGAGASFSCPDLRGSGTIDVSGGDGADADGCPRFAERQDPGEDGTGPGVAGNGGVSADNRVGIDDQSLCSSPKTDDINDGSPAIFFPELGGRGGAGDNGTEGSGASNSDGLFTSMTWRGESGQSGQPGVPGAGGGGGGASHGIEETDGDDEFYVGATGGGGGSGGCAGESGAGGTAGGGSFAIILVEDGTDGDIPVIENNSLRRGSGGAGGSGGIAGSGGDGGTPGGGGTGLINGDGQFSFCLSDGRSGGVGGRGGDGGGGGGGAGGASFDILVISPNPSSTVSDSGIGGANTFPLDPGTDTGGQGGSGGSSRSNSGEDGVDGSFGRILELSR
jgi:hypothetical protein